MTIASFRRNVSRWSPRWFQFSLAKLLILIGVLAASLGWFSSGSRQQQRAVAAVREFGGEIVYDYQQAGQKGPPGPAWLIRLLGEEYFASVVEVSLQHWDHTHRSFERTDINEALLPHLGNLSGLRKLGIYYFDCLNYRR